MRAVIGLGNPGPRYAATRHNLGFWVLERLLRRGAWIGQAYPWGVVYQGPQGSLVRPLTYVNRSGEAVQEALQVLKLRPEDLLVVFDDADLGLGELRLRMRGGPGTHNGMRSILAALGTEDVPRLRVGIGRPPQGDWAGWVLSPPSPEEIRPLEEAVDKAADLAWTFLQQGMSRALDRYATLVAPGEDEDRTRII